MEQVWAVRRGSTPTLSSYPPLHLPSACARRLRLLPAQVRLRRSSACTRRVAQTISPIASARDDRRKHTSLERICRRGSSGGGLWSAVLPCQTWPMQASASMAHWMDSRASTPVRFRPRRNRCSHFRMDRWSSHSGRRHRPCLPFHRPLLPLCPRSHLPALWSSRSDMAYVTRSEAASSPATPTAARG